MILQIEGRWTFRDEWLVKNVETSNIICDLQGIEHSKVVRLSIVLSHLSSSISFIQSEK
jgi:hypothetical protein